MHDDQEQLTESLSAYLDGALVSAERDALERHLSTCPACRAEIEDLRRVRVLLRALPQPAAPRSFALPIATPRVGSRVVIRRSPAWTRAAQWAGGLAAALGAGLLIAGAIQSTMLMTTTSSRGSDTQYAQAGTASNAPSTSITTRGPDIARSPSVSDPTPPYVITVTPTPTVQPSSSGGQPGTGSQIAGIPLLAAGATLLVGGGATLAAGTITRRRARRGARRR